MILNEPCNIASETLFYLNTFISIIIIREIVAFDYAGGCDCSGEKGERKEIIIDDDYRTT